MFSQQETPSGLPESVTQFGEPVTQFGTFLVAAAVLYLAGRVVVVPLVVRAVRRRNRNNPTLVSAAETYLGVLAVVLAVLVALIVAGYRQSILDTDSALVIAALTFALGVAGQEVFASLVSGLFLVADRDFNVGDVISWSGGEGTVEAVDFRVTRIRTANNETITVPNTELTTNALTRPFGRDRFRITERVFLSYEDDTERALKELQQLAATHDQVLEDPGPRARIIDLGGDSITVQAEFWIEDPTRVGVADVRSDFRRRVRQRFTAAGITLSPPADRNLSGTVSVTGATE